MTRTRYHFETPQSIEDAEDRLVLLIEETQSIEAQLAGNKRTDQKMSEEAYQAWRSKAVSALNIKRAEQRFIKAWVAREKTAKYQKAIAAIDGSRSLSLLQQLLLLIKEWIRKKILIPSREEQEFLDVVKEYLKDPED